VTDRDLLHELEGRAGDLLERHARVAQEWFPHDYIPYSMGRDFDKDPWTPDQARLTGIAQTAFHVNLLTEDNLPSYHREIHRMFGGAKDSPWTEWLHRWTAEEGRHAIVLRDYLVVTRNIDPEALERGRMETMMNGYDTEEKPSLQGMAYVAFQELATRVSHRNTGLYSQDPVADRIMARIAADENLHMVFYRDMLQSALELAPDEAMEAVTREVVGFEMPGAGMAGFSRKSYDIAMAGIYDLRVHHDDVVQPLLKYWKIWDVEGLSARGEAARDELAAFLVQLDAQASKFEDRRERAAARAARRAE
jgi:acyl-[acyl-carrier-protein] desaturase